MPKRLLAATATLLVALIAPALAQSARKIQGCDLARADTTVHGITLGDEASFIRVIGNDRRTVLDDPTSNSAWSLYASRDNKQLLMLRHHAGDAVNSYREAEVKYGRHDRKPANLRVYEFVTGNGIKLGMRQRAVLKRLGPCFRSTHKAGNEIIRYEIQNEKAETGVLKAKNMPQYYAEYEFHNRKLIRFAFGHSPQ